MLATYIERPLTPRVTPGRALLTNADRRKLIGFDRHGAMPAEIAMLMGLPEVEVRRELARIAITQAKAPANKEVA